MLKLLFILASHIKPLRCNVNMLYVVYGRREFSGKTYRLWCQSGPGAGVAFVHFHCTRCRAGVGSASMPSQLHPCPEIYTISNI